jgi:hypothetical protein
LGAVCGAAVVFTATAQASTLAEPAQRGARAVTTSTFSAQGGPIEQDCQEYTIRITTLPPELPWPRCFAGGVGSTVTDFRAYLLQSRIYYGNVTVINDTGCWVIPFRPYESVGWGGDGRVVRLEITPPF